MICGASCTRSSSLLHTLFIITPAPPLFTHSTPAVIAAHKSLFASNPRMLDESPAGVRAKAFFLPVKSLCPQDLLDADFFDCRTDMFTSLEPCLEY